MNKLILPLTSAATLALISTSSFATTSQDAQLKMLSAEVKKLSAQTKTLKREISKIQSHTSKKAIVKHHQEQLPLGHFATITTSPFMGKNSTFAPYDLLYQTSSMNEDLRLLEIKRDFINNLSQEGYDFKRPIVQISGGIEGQAYSTSGFGTSATDSIALSSAGLEFNALASKWASAFMSINYDSSPVSSGNRTPNGKMYLKRGFATLGDLSASPFYGSIGLMYVPFGRYSSNMLSTPLTLSMGRIRSETMLVGAKFNNGLFGSIYGFTGNQTSQGSEVFFKQGGVNLGLRNKLNNKVAYTIGTGWTSNIADSEGMQNTGLGSINNQFSGFAITRSTTGNNNNLIHRIGGYDVYGNLVINDFTLISEFMGAASPFYAADMSFNNKGAQPKALHVEVDYTLPYGKKYSTTLGVAFGQTWQALALNLPKNSYSAFIQTSLLQNTIESIEYRHDRDYSTSTVANGGNAEASNNITGTGKDRNSVIMQLGVYF